MAFGRRQPAYIPPASLIWDAAERDQDARDARAAARAADSRPVEDLFRRVGPVWEMRYFFTAIVATVETGWAAAWTDAKPQSPAAWLVRGAVETTVGWSIRPASKRLNCDTEAEHEDRVRQQFDRAELSLRRAAELIPHDPTPYVFLMQCERGRDRGRAASEAHYAQVVLRDPHHWGAAIEMLLTLQPGWYGSPAAMLYFARGLHRSAPPGHPSHSILPTAHIRRWNRIGNTEGFADAARYWTLPEVRADIASAHSAYESGPEPPAWCREVAVRNLFAFCFWKSEQPSKARVEFDRLGPYAAGEPWSLDPLGADAAFWAARAETCS